MPALREEAEHFLGHIGLEKGATNSADTNYCAQKCLKRIISESQLILRERHFYVNLFRAPRPPHKCLKRIISESQLIVRERNFYVNSFRTPKPPQKCLKRIISESQLIVREQNLYVNLFRTPKPHRNV